jgi:transcriptional regulator with XRE-family HTH domain
MDHRQETKIIREFGRNLKRIRTEKGFSIRQLADLADMNLGNLSDLELGKKNPYMTTVVHLARTLGVTVQELVSA